MVSPGWDGSSKEGVMAERWMTTREAAEVWSNVVQSREKAMNEVLMRRMCREGGLKRRGVEVIIVDRKYRISRPSLMAYLWLASQDTSRNAAEACGITQDRIYEIVGQVGSEAHAGGGKVMDDLWRLLMLAEFEKCGGCE